jgi:hypothetical protein
MVRANINEEKVLVESPDILHNQIRVFKQEGITFPRKHQITTSINKPLGRKWFGQSTPLISIKMCYNQLLMAKLLP